MKAWTGGDIIKTLNHNGEGPADYLFKFVEGLGRAWAGPDSAAEQSRWNGRPMTSGGRIEGTEGLVVSPRNGKACRPRT